MVLRKRINLSYRWRLFIPMLLMVWTIIGVLVGWQYKRLSDYREANIIDQLSRVSERVLYVNEKNVDIQDYLDFLSQYFAYSMYSEMRVTVYGQYGAVLGHMGKIIDYNEKYFDNTKDFNTKDFRTTTNAEGKTQERLFYIHGVTSRDGMLKVCVVMPYTTKVAQAVAPGNEIWGIGALLTIISTIVVFYSTSFLSRNITMLRKFASNAAEGRPIKDVDKLPHDELGEISREIFKIYEQRIAAVEKSSREHRIALHAVEEKSRIRRQLTNNINHELKTPIGVIRGYLDTILANPDMDDATRTHFLNRTLQNVERLCSLMNDVSAMTRLEEGSDNIPISDVNMHDLLYAIENDVECSHLAGNMKFSYDVPLDCHVKGNQNLLSAMLMNLVKNAAIHSHGTEISFTLLSESAKFYVFSFADNGNGVAEEHLPHLFERFYRVDSGRSRKVGGTGLGLPIVKNTVVALGGTISVHNRSMGGLEFVFSLRKWE